jgi:hypothetical protein
MLEHIKGKTKVRLKL